MRVSNDVYLDLFRKVHCIFKEVGNDIADTLAQAFERPTFRREAGNIRLFDIPDAGLAIPRRPDDRVPFHHSLPDLLWETMMWDDIVVSKRFFYQPLHRLVIAKRQLDRTTLDAEAFRQELVQALAPRLQRVGLGDDAELAGIHRVPETRRFVAADLEMNRLRRPGRRGDENLQRVDRDQNFSRRARLTIGISWILSSSSSEIGSSTET